MKKKKGSLGWMALKIDLEKAYNRVSWLFIKEVLTAYGFDAHWVGWVSKCISSATVKLLINGAYFRDIKPKRGLRQGDSLSLICLSFAPRFYSGCS